MIQLTCGTDEAGSRLDRLLRKRLALKSLSAIYRMLRRGDVKINGRKARPDYRICDGDFLEIITLDKAELARKYTTPPQQLENLVNTGFFAKNFCILFEDESLLLCNKPVHLAVHPGTGHNKNDTLIDLAKSYLFNKAAPEQYTEPVLAHRLDKETSGVIMIAKNRQILREIHTLQRNEKITKEYRALCHGAPKQKKGTISLDLQRTHSTGKGTKMKVRSRGKKSQSRYILIWKNKNICELSIVLDTGKTHQIRVHTAHMGFPVIGDTRYGDQSRDRFLFDSTQGPGRMYLHAHTLSFPHPVTRMMIRCTAPVPGEFLQMKNAAQHGPPETT
ncbi:MAG: RluA family pseudouridine synthase [Chitinivibrionales bacterium]|nr:RluA family pseudouridine synthase [Chitinivibrionales bacterium]